MENNYIISDLKYDTETTMYQNGEIKSSPAVYEIDIQPVLSGTATNITLSGKMQIFDDGSYHFMPSVSSSASRYNTLFVDRHAEVRETKKHLICTIRIPKHWRIKEILALYIEASKDIHHFIKTFKRR